MKIFMLFLAGILATTTFAPEASAVPAFARQTGMACSACHFQSFPILTKFGKAFKMGGFTMMGAQGKVEGEQGLSMPDTLNMAVILKARYKKTGGTDTAAANNNLSTNSGRIDLPDEFALFAAGRVSENIGALVEISIAGAPGNAGVANFKLPLVSDLGDMKFGVVPFSGDAGAAYGFDLFATGSNTTGRVIENAEGYSVAKYLGTHTEVSGAAIYVANDDFHVNYTPWVQSDQATAAGVTATKLGGNYLRAAWTPSFSGWDIGVGVQNFSGNSLKGIDTVTLNAAIAGGAAFTLDAAGNAISRDSATILDAQAQGAVADMPLGIYASFGRAAGQATGAAVNTFNGGTDTRRAFGILADLGVIPETLGVQLGLIRAKTGALLNGSNETDNAFTLGARYKFRQNVNMGVAYTKFSGTAYEAGGSLDATVPSTALTPNTGTSLLNLTLIAAF
ncbi:MAG: hypothetical protein WAW75_06375 [Gallionella sp.]